MSMQLRLSRAILAGLFLSCGALPALAGALSTSGQGSKALAMGGAFTALADDGSAVYYNPAGMSQSSGTHAEASMSLIFPLITYTTPSGAEEESKKYVYAPTLFMTHGFNDKLGMGLGLYSAYARSAVLHDDLENGFLSQRSRMTRTDLSMAMSYKVIEPVSVGLGVIGGYSVMDQSIPAGPSLRIKDDADGFGVGGIAGLLWKINEYVQAGGTYRSPMTVKHSGDRTMEQDGSSVTSDSDTDVDYPASVGLGVAVKPLDKLTLCAEADWYGWSRFSKITTSTDPWPDSTTDMATDDSWDFRVGGEYVLAYDVALRAGYGYIQSAIPETNIMPCVPDGNGHELDIGFGKHWEHWKLEMNYECLFVNEFTADGNIYGYTGDYKVVQHLAGITAGYQW